MTRCKRKEVNLKSSAYNQTGENYFEQLSAYNSMTYHLRRIFSAKSIVNTSNKNYIFMKRRQCKTLSDKDTCLNMKVIDDVIDRLAYDTQHHPLDILKMNLSSKHLHQYDRNVEHRRTVVCNNQTCCEESSHRQRSRSQKMTSRTKTCPSKCKRCTTTTNSTCEKKLKYMRRELPCIIDQSTCYSPRRCVKDSFIIPCTTTAVLDSSMYKSRSSIQETSDNQSVCSSTSRSYGDSDYDKIMEQSTLKRMSQKEEEKKYIRFVYDITKEIMRSGLYTDKELQDVFKKHISMNKGILNMNKMLYEIYQLKISLNILDDSDTDDELEDLIHAQKLLSISEIRPPTPPKVLDENKVMEKLKSYQECMDARCKPLASATTKSVVLVDANPELFVTERDVLMSLMEVGVDPKQAQHVCKSLLYRSKDILLPETVQAEIKTSCASYERNLETQQTTDKCICVENGMNNNDSKSIADIRLTDFTGKREAISSTSDPISIKDEIVQIDLEIHNHNHNDNIES